MPADLVPLAGFDTKGRGRLDGHSAEYKAIRKAIDDGRIDAVTYRHRRYVSRSDAEKVIRSVPACPAHRVHKSGTLEARVAALEELVRDLRTQLGIEG